MNIIKIGTGKMYSTVIKSTQSYKTQGGDPEGWADAEYGYASQRAEAKFCFYAKRSALRATFPLDELQRAGFDVTSCRTHFYIWAEKEEELAEEHQLVLRAIEEMHSIKKKKLAYFVGAKNSSRFEHNALEAASKCLEANMLVFYEITKTIAGCSTVGYYSEKKPIGSNERLTELEKMVDPSTHGYVVIDYDKEVCEYLKSIIASVDQLAQNAQKFLADAGKLPSLAKAHLNVLTMI